MEIRVYRPEDRIQIAELWNAVFPNATGHNESLRSIDRKIMVYDGLFFVAVDGNKVVGTVLAGYDGHRGWLYSLAVEPSYRRRRIGSQLVQHAQIALTKLGCQKINLQIRAENESVVAFYESLGFQTEKRISMGKRVNQ